MGIHFLPSNNISGSSAAKTNAVVPESHPATGKAITPSCLALDKSMLVTLMSKETPRHENADFEAITPAGNNMSIEPAMLIFDSMVRNGSEIGKKFILPRKLQEQNAHYVIISFLRQTAEQAQRLTESAENLTPVDGIQKLNSLKTSLGAFLTHAETTIVQLAKNIVEKELSGDPSEQLASFLSFATSDVWEISRTLQRESAAKSDEFKNQTGDRQTLLDTSDQMQVMMANRHSTVADANGNQLFLFRHHLSPLYKAAALLGNLNQKFAAQIS